MLDETRRTLLDSARRKFGSLPPEVVVDLVLRHARDADFAVQESALEALHRRWGFAERDGLAVETRPKKTVLGTYTTARPGEKKRGRRPYRTELAGIDPLRGSCDCPDFVRSSLGACKHLLVVAADVHARPEHAKQARGETAAPEPLSWVPDLALRGELDRLAGLRVDDSVPPSVRRLITGAGPLESVRRDPARRARLLADLAKLEASPAAAAIVREEQERASRLATCGAAMKPALAALSSLKRALYPYQREGVERFLAAGRLLLADDMGLGKTTQAIASCHALFTAKKIHRGLVIVPASLKAQWKREWDETTSVPIAIVDGNPQERAAQYGRLRSGFLILNYEQLLRDGERIKALAPDMVVLDEAQRIKNYASKSAVYVKSLEPAYRLVLTGTPMENRLEELASILDWVDDVALSPKWRLVPWFTAWTGDAGSGKAGARNLDTLRERMKGCVVRRVRKDVLAQLPKRTDTRVPVEMTPQQSEAHDELSSPIAQLAARAATRPLSQPEFLRLMSMLTTQRMIANGLGQLRFEELWPTYATAVPDPTLLEGLFMPKLDELRRLVSDLVVGQGRKVVVFSQWRRMLRLAEWSIRDLLASAGAQAVFFTGAEKQSQRTQSIVDFHDDDRVKIMFLSDAGGVGLNLQKAASACINLELPWNPAVLEQRIGRIYRLGQKLPIDVYNLVSEGSIEARIAGLVGAKQALFSGLFDGTSDEVRFDGSASFLQQVEKLVDRGPLPEAPVAASEDVRIEEVSDAILDDAVPPPAPSRDVAALFSALRVERTPLGGIRIEAPPEAATQLVALFEGMAKLLAPPS